MIILFSVLEAVQNPYLTTVGQQHEDGLTAIEAALPGTEFLDTIISYIETTYYPSADLQTKNEIVSVLSFSIDNYINNHLKGYSAQQNYFIRALLNGLFEVPVDSIQTFLMDVNDQINRSGMSTAEEVPLFMATAVAAFNYDYWVSAIASPGNWSPYFNADAAINYANIPHWVYAAIFGTLASANHARTYGLIDPPPVIGVDMVSAIAGSLAMGAGKVIEKFLPRLGTGMSGGGCSCGG